MLAQFPSVVDPDTIIPMPSTKPSLRTSESLSSSRAALQKRYSIGESGGLWTTVGVRKNVRVFAVVSGRWTAVSRFCIHATMWSIMRRSTFPLERLYFRRSRATPLNVPWTSKQTIVAIYIFFSTLSGSSLVPYVMLFLLSHFTSIVVTFREQVTRFSDQAESFRDHAIQDSSIMS